jgi:hypothetical protein
VWGRLVAVLTLGLTGCVKPADLQQTMVGHSQIAIRVPQTLVNECAARLNDKPFGFIGDTTYKFSQPLAPDPRFACLYAQKSPFEEDVQSAFYSAPIEQVSGWPGKIGNRTIYWCWVKFFPGKDPVLLNHQAGLTLPQDVVQRAETCGIPMKRIKGIFG